MSFVTMSGVLFFKGRRQWF